MVNIVNLLHLTLLHQMIKEFIDTSIGARSFFEYAMF
jgi:hypothetical protein